MNELLPSKEIQEGLRGVIELLPLVYLIIVLMASIALDVVNLDGVLIKHYKLKVLAICLVLAVVVYFFYPEGQAKVRDIPTLIIGCIASIVLVKLFAKWRQNKINKK